MYGKILEKRLIIERDVSGMCHASTVLKMPDGEILAAWFGGSREGAGDTGIYLSRRKEGERFSAPERMAASGEAHWNPVLFSPDGNTVLLYYKVGMEIAQWRTYVRISEDGGKTFGEERELVFGDRGGRGPVKNKPLRLRNGRVLAPASLEQGEWVAFVDLSDDGGRTFQRSSLIRIPDLDGANQRGIKSSIPVSPQSFQNRGVIQPALWAEDDRNIHMLLRSSEGRIYRSDSRDGGRSWTDAAPTSLLNNNSGIDAVKLADGRIVLAYNPVGTNWGERSPLSLAVSEDGGKAFRHLCHLEEGAGEYSYPAMISEGTTILLTYTYQRKNIAFCRIRL